MESLFLTPPDIELREALWSDQESAGYFLALRSSIVWRQDALRIAGRETPFPRLTAWYGDEGAEYVYSGVLNIPLPWTPELLAIKTTIEAVADASFNSVLLNLYRSGSDSMGWHSDDERGLDAIIASVSLGAVRTFQIRRKAPPRDTVSLRLSDGSLLLMKGSTQREWQHRVPKEPAPGERINLTFRRVHRRYP